MEEQNKNEEFSFIKEQIKERPINKRRLLQKLLWFALCGIVFGLMACISFVVAKPKLELLTKPHPNNSTDSSGSILGSGPNANLLNGNDRVSNRVENESQNPDSADNDSAGSADKTPGNQADASSNGSSNGSNSASGEGAGSSLGGADSSLGNSSHTSNSSDANGGNSGGENANGSSSDPSSNSGSGEHTEGSSNGSGGDNSNGENPNGSSNGSGDDNSGGENPNGSSNEIGDGNSSDGAHTDGQTGNASEGGNSGQNSQQSADLPPRELEAEDFQALQSKLYAIGKKGNRSVVTVTGVTSNIDWFDSAYESENQASGIIIANTGQELLILTERRVIDNAEAISITFINDTEVAATLKKYDGNTGIAIISVALDAIPQETMSKIDVAALGNSIPVNQGTVVIAIGSPLGASYSILCGTVTSCDNTVSTWDSSYTVFTTDIMGSSNGSGALINLSGEVVGLVMQGYSSAGDQNTITALSISQLKDIITDLSNGRAIPYLGIKVSTVTDDIANEYGLPKGVYIKNVETDIPSPAMDAGLLEGDVIIAMDGAEVKTVDEYTQTLLSLEPEQHLRLTILRQNGKEYAQLECTATVGVRQ